MIAGAAAMLAVSVALGSAGTTTPSLPAPPGEVAVLRPDGDARAWDGERMRGARERLKDILPGGRT